MKKGHQEKYPRKSDLKGTSENREGMGEQNLVQQKQGPNCKPDWGAAPLNGADFEDSKV